MMNINIPNVPGREFFVTFLKLINVTFSHKGDDYVMSPMEMKALSYFLMLPFKKFKYQLFSSLAKKKAIQAMIDDGWDMTHNNLNNKLYSMTNKGFLQRDEDNILHLHPSLFKTLDNIHKNKEIRINFKVQWIEEEDEKIKS